MVHIFRPFWSYDIQKTEKWLSEMARLGYHFTSVNTKTRRFRFEKGHAEPFIYHIDYQKAFVPSISKTMMESGWREKYTTGKWRFSCLNKSEGDGTQSPLHDGVLHRNRHLLYLFGGIFGYLIFTALLYLVIVIWTQVSHVPVTIEKSPLWIVAIFSGVIVWTIVPYSAIKLYRTNKRLLQPIQRPTGIAINNGKTITKWRLGWHYAPDKLENWLMDMASDGLQLSKVGWFGTRFYFQLEEPKRIVYHVDYQNSVQQDYFDLHQDAGWRHVYSYDMPLQKWFIWSKVYEEVSPTFYSGGNGRIKQARRLAMNHSTIFGLLFALYVYIIWQEFYLVQHYLSFRVTWTLLLVLGLASIQYLWLMMCSIRYYMRVKRDS